jgi:hypothetical protein
MRSASTSRFLPEKVDLRKRFVKDQQAAECALLGQQKKIEQRLRELEILVLIDELKLYLLQQGDVEAKRQQKNGWAPCSSRRSPGSKKRSRK